MPLVQIFLREGTSPDYRKALADGIHRALIESIAIPPGDRFQVITQHPPGDLIYSPDYLGVSRSHLSHILAGKVAGVPAIPHVRAGRRALIRRVVIDQWLLEQEHGVATSMAQ